MIFQFHLIIIPAYIFLQHQDQHIQSWCSYKCCIKHHLFCDSPLYIHTLSVWISSQNNKILCPKFPVDELIYSIHINNSHCFSQIHCGVENCWYIRYIAKVTVLYHVLCRYYPALICIPLFALLLLMPEGVGCCDWRVENT